MHESWYDYIRPKCKEKAKLCFIVYIKTEDIYVYIAKDIKRRFDTSNYELERPLSRGKIKRVTGLMKVELGEKIMTDFFALRPKKYDYLLDDGNENQKAKDTKKYVIKLS